jgi:CHAT domain-containing protein
MLPLHAAGEPGGPNALDYVISSYSPTVRVLMNARRAGSKTLRQTTVAVRDTPDMESLACTVTEASEVARRYPGTIELVNEGATAERVLASIRDSTRAHFACHAVSNPQAPSMGGLVLHDRILHVGEITRMRLQEADLAYLSACTTASPGPKHVDEAIHLASAFQVAGFRDVVGTLWQINDGVGAAVGRAFYDELSDDGARDAAVALHQVVSRVRGAHPRNPELWAVFIHSGR